MLEKRFTPNWIKKAPKKNSYRSVFKWGAPKGFKHPNKNFYNLIKQELELTDEDFKNKKNIGNEKIICDSPVKLDEKHIKFIKKIVGEKNIKTDDYERVKYSTGMTMLEVDALRNKKHYSIADIVVHPRNKEEIKNIVKYCNKHKIPITVYGGGSSVNMGVMPKKGGISLVMNTHMNKILEFNETDQIVRVQAGMMGPDFENALNNADKLFNTKSKYTCGHFPQSFEFSSVGGWVITLGSGQASSYYGDAYNLVFSQEFITPVGEIKTLEYPATATGPKLNDIMKGSEGAFGILTELTMKVFKYQPKNRQDFAFIFPTWRDAVNASRTISQGEFGMPAVFRISDPEETITGLKVYNLEGTPLDKIIELKGYKHGERCLCIGHTEGEKEFSKHVKKMVKKICKNHGAMYLSGYPVKKWRKGRFADPYMREDLQDYGIISDTVETAVKWSDLHKVHEGVREFIKKRSNTICLTHASHFYPQGTNLYFIFIAKYKDIEEYKELLNGIMDNIQNYGGSISHHHGVGKLFGSRMTKHLGNEQVAALKALKAHFDPNEIMNPGQMGL